MVQNRASPILMTLETFHICIPEGYSSFILYALFFILYALMRVYPKKR